MSVTSSTQINVGSGSGDGIQIGYKSTDKVGMYGATPTAQSAAIADATDATTVITKLNLLLAYLRLRGDVASA